MFKNNNIFLFDEIRKGNKKAFAYIFDNYYSHLCNYIYSYTKNAKQAEDIVQDSMLIIWENRQKIKPQKSVKNYIFKVAYHQFINNYRKYKKHLDYVEEIKQTSFNHFSEKDEEYLESKNAILLHEIQNLPPKCKEVFLLNKQSGLKYKEIAEELNISIRTVENHISKAMKLIKKRVDG